MDRPLDPRVHRARIARRVALAVGCVAGALAAFAALSKLIEPSLGHAALRTARVDIGPLDATVTASGTVVPEVEKVLASPIDTRVLKVLKRPGAALQPGDAILELDVSESNLALGKLDQALALKDNQVERSRVDLEGTLAALDSQLEIKALQLEAFRAAVKRNRKCFTDGIVSEEELERSQLDEARAGVELAQLRRARAIAGRSTAAQISGLALERDTLRKERAEQQRQLDLATTKSDRAGVLTYVVSEEGAQVHKGDVLARIADLTAFRVDATISEVHASRIRVGQAAAVQIDELRLDGAVSRVVPAIQNGLVTLSVSLRENNHARLRSNLRVEVDLVTDRRARTLRVAKGSFGGSEGATDVFVVAGERAVKRRVRLGVASADRYEVLDGLAEGDEVILNDMSQHAHLDHIRITGTRGSR
ncbi:MAG TPA: HlyD family efflux transporter periplasmic adaptor subunit [Kofleriaceae bacterium]|nr:HlyD family efflux transporter periplasmic adaptor subunit [Kofleriaceae bacterium]